MHGTSFRGALARFAAASALAALAACGAGAKNQDCGAKGTFYRDADGDGYGDPAVAVEACSAPLGHVAVAGDCDDADAAIHPGAAEACNGADDDCDGQADEGLAEVTSYRDADRDGYGDPGAPATGCAVPRGYVDNAADCDDTLGALNPDTAWYADADGDGYPGAADPVVQCLSPGAGYTAGFAVVAFDCDDGASGVHPGRGEILGNGVDDDCDPATTDSGALVQASLAGDFHLHLLTAGDAGRGDWVGWGSGWISMGADGTPTRWDVRYHNGAVESALPVFRADVLAGGVITFADDIQVTGAITPDARDVAIGRPDGDTALSLLVAQRWSQGFTLADLVGEWAVHALAVDGGGVGGYAYRGTHRVDAAGAVTTVLTVDPGGEETRYDAIHVEDRGRVLRGTAPGDEYTLSADKNLLVGTHSRDSRFHVLELALRAGGSHAASDLAGDWNFLALHTGGLPEWIGGGRGALRVSAAGDAEVLYQEWTRPEMALPGGALGVSPSGEVTHGALPDLHGQISRDNDVLVATFGGAGGPAGLLVAYRRYAPPTTMLADAAASASAVVGPGGGAVTATGADGTGYTLRIPAGALSDDVTVALAPVSSVEGPLPAGGLLGLVQFAPEGLVLQVPATLSIAPPSGTVPAEMLGFEHRGTAADRFGYQAVRPVGSMVDVDVLHFSGAGVVSGSGGSQPSPNEVFGSELEHLVDLTLLYGVPWTDPDAKAALDALVDAWLTTAILPRMAAAQTLADLADAMYGLAYLGEALGHQDVGTFCTRYPGHVSSVRTTFGNAVARLLPQADRACAAQGDPCVQLDLMRQVVQYVRLTQLLPSCLGITVSDLSSFGDFCGGQARALPTTIRIEPRETGTSVGDGVELAASGFNMIAERIRPSVSWRPSPGTAAIASVVPLADGEVAMAKVTGLSPGTGGILAELKGVACVWDLARVSVSPRLQGLWAIETTARRRAKDTAECRAMELPAADRVRITVGPPLPELHGGALAIRWEGSALNLRPELLRGGLEVTVLEVNGTAQWPEAGIEPVHRSCKLAVDIEGKNMMGTCDFRWTGFYVPGQGYTGCNGTDAVSLSFVSE